MKTLLKICLGIGLIFALAGCVQLFEDENKQATTGEPIVIGALLELSGGEAVLGIPAQHVFEIAAKEINDAGGINGRPLKFEYEDGACNATEAQKAIENLVSVKKVKVVIGALCSSETLTSAPVVEKNQVVLLSPGASSPKITEAGDFVFRNYPSDVAQGEAMADLANKKGYKKAGVITEEQPYTEGIADAFSASFQKLGGETIVEKFPKDASDFRTQITKLQSAGVDLFFVNTQAPDKAQLVVKQLQEAGIKGPLFLNDVAIGAVKDVVETYKDYLEGSFGSEVPFDKTNPGIMRLQEVYKARTGKDLGFMSYMAPTYDAVYIIKEAIEKAGEDSVKIKDYLYTVKGRKGLAGTLSFDSNGDPTSDYRHVPRVVKNGAVEDYKE